MNIGPSPFEWLVFDKSGALRDRDALARVRTMIGQPGISDLVVISHGWNNDLDDASALYRALWSHASAALATAGRDPARIAVAGVLWPAKAYDARYDGAADFVASAGEGVALASCGDDARDVPAEDLERMIAQVRAFVDDSAFDPAAEAARRAALPSDASAPYDFFASAMEALGYDLADDDPELRQDAAVFAKAGTRDGANELLAAFSRPHDLPLDHAAADAEGLGDTIRSLFSGPRSGVVWALNKLAYYTMKKRAGVVGEGLASALQDLRAQRALRLHLTGHSFGGRLVTATAAALSDAAPVELRSMTLFQAAYSHNGLTEGKGPFAGVIGKPTGPIAFTHTHNDRACTIAYPLASRLSGDTTEALGDANDPYGAMGANGPQLKGAMMADDHAGTAFAPVPGKINRFRADGYIVRTDSRDAHNNVANTQCGRLLAAAITA